VHRIEVSPVAPGELEKLKSRIRRQDYERLRDVVRSLANEPRPKGVRKLKGEDKVYRVRVGSYRVVYDVYDNDNLVLILLTSCRSETTYRR
jgi:mRNA interferase RelE/StbE